MHNFDTENISKAEFQNAMISKPFIAFGSKQYTFCTWVTEP